MTSKDVLKAAFAKPPATPATKPAVDGIKDTKPKLPSVRESLFSPVGTNKPPSMWRGKNSWLNTHVNH